MPPPLWICDVNGVLVDASFLIRDAFAATARQFGFPFAAGDFERVKELGVLDAYRLLGAAHDPFACRAFHLRHYRTHVTEVRPCAGVRDVLARAKTEGIRIAAATSHGAIAEAVLVNTGLYLFIDGLLTQEEVKRPKPHPDQVIRILELFDLQTDDGGRSTAVYVGDTRADIQAGKAAGVRTVGVTYGLSSEEEIRSARPDCVIRSFAEMLSLPRPESAAARIQTRALAGTSTINTTQRSPLIEPNVA